MREFGGKCYNLENHENKLWGRKPILSYRPAHFLKCLWRAFQKISWHAQIWYNQSVFAIFLYAHGRVFTSTEKLQIKVAHDLWRRLSKARVNRIQMLITVHFIKNVEPFPHLGEEELFLKSQINRKSTFIYLYTSYSSFSNGISDASTFPLSPWSTWTGLIKWKKGTATSGTHT